MPVVAQEIKMYRSATVSNSSDNGGLMSSVEVVSGAPNNLFPNASLVERANGSTTYRKVFFKVANSANDLLAAPRIWQDTNTAGDDRVIFMPGTQRGTQGGLTGNELKYGMGTLATGVNVGATAIDVNVEHGATPIFLDDRLIRISNKTTPTSPGDEVWVRIDGTPVVNGNVVSLVLAEGLPVGFLSGAKVSSVLEEVNTQATITQPIDASVGGSISGSWATYAYVDGRGAIEQNWTLTFTSATAFNISGDTVGAVGSGNTSSGAAPVNTPFSAPYFTLLGSLFVGTWETGDTVTFTTHPYAIPIWCRRVIPASCASTGQNTVSIYIDGETV